MKKRTFKVRLAELDMRQVELLEPLSRRGYELSPCQLSLAINGYMTSDRGLKIVAAIDEIISEWEKKGR